MSNISLNLENCKIFENKILEIDKKLTFIFGKNGTGKSTLTSLFQSQVNNYDIRCFQGFEGIVGEDGKLNAVILGEENNKIDTQIDELEREISKKESKIKEIEEDTLQFEINPNNLWKQVHDMRKDYENQKWKIDNFYSNSAKNIKNNDNPSIAVPSYNKNNFQAEIKNAKLLTNDEIKKHKKLIKEEIKIAKEIYHETVDFHSLLVETNNLLAKKVIAKETILEISGNNAKANFAKDGLNIHDINDKCAFCAKKITKDRYEKLQRYFLDEDVENLENEIKGHIDLIKDKAKQVKDIVFDVNNFYTEYSEEINAIKTKFDEKNLMLYHS